MLKIAQALVLALLVAGCSSGPKLFSNVNPEADFSRYATYNYESTLGTDDRKGYRSILSNFMIAATDRQMQARGYRKADNPDVIINFFVASQEKLRTTSSPTMGGYYGYRAGYYGAYGGYETRTVQYTEGTVNIDLVDNRVDQLAWEGVAVGRIDDEVRQNLELAVDTVVAEVFTKFTYTAPGFVPPEPAGE